MGLAIVGRGGCIELTTEETRHVDTLTKQAIGFGIVIGLLFGVPAKSVGVGIVFGLMFGAGFYMYRKRKASS